MEGYLMTEQLTADVAGRIDKVWENRLRRVLDRQGYTLRKCPRRDPLACGFGTYMIFDAGHGGAMLETCPVSGFGLTIDEVEAWAVS